MPEVRRLLLALAEHGARRAHRLRWSRWRRAHQARANRCHAARRARERALRPKAPASQRVPPALVELTAAEWARLAPLLPPQRPRTGRPRNDHRTVLGGILWVLRNRASWRDMPARFGNYKHRLQALPAVVRHRPLGAPPQRPAQRLRRWPRRSVAVGRLESHWRGADLEGLRPSAVAVRGGLTPAGGPPRLGAGRVRMSSPLGLPEPAAAPLSGGGAVAAVAAGRARPARGDRPPGVADQLRRPGGGARRDRGPARGAPVGDADRHRRRAARRAWRCGSRPRRARPSRTGRGWWSWRRWPTPCSCREHHVARRPVATMTALRWSMAAARVAGSGWSGFG